MIKRLITSLFIILAFCVTPSFATEPANLVRVGITDNNFQNVLRQSVTIYATSDCVICDKQSKRMLMNIPSDTDIVIKNSISGLEVTVNGQGGTLRDFVIISPEGLLGVKDLKRKGLPAIYHGAFELIQRPDHKGFYLVNLVELQ